MNDKLTALGTVARTKSRRGVPPPLALTALAALLPRGAAAAGSQSDPQPPSMAGETAASGPERHCREDWFDVAGCHDAPATPFRLFLGVSLGVAKANAGGPFGFNNGIGSVTDAGPSWGLQGGIELLPWLALEARYAGNRLSVTGSASPAGSLAYVSSMGDFTVRLTAPLHWIRPYLFGGIGYASIALSGSQSAKSASPLFSGSQPEIPMGVGVDVPLTWHLSVGAEASYRFQINETFSNDTLIDGGDIDSFEILFRARL